MTIYIFYEHLVREWEAINKLKDVLKKKNNKVYIFSALYEKNYSYICSIRHKPDIIIMPWFDCAQHEKIVWFLTKINPKVRILNLHHEQLGEPSGFNYFMPKTIYGKKAAFHIAWGDNFKKHLLNNGVNSDRIFVTGNIRTDLLSKCNVNKEYLSDNYNLDIAKPWILFAESRGYYSQRTRKSELKALLNVGVTKNEIIEQMKFERKSMKGFLDDINSIPRSWYSKYEFIYRPHPGTNPPSNLPSWVKIISDRSISDWIHNVDFFISCGSTSIFEAEIAGIPCVSYDNYPRPYERTIVGLDKYPIINSFNEINDDLIKRVKLETGHIYEDYFGLVDCNAVNRICDVIYKIANSKYDSRVIYYSKKICKSSFFDFCKLFIYEVVSYFMVKTSLLEVFKWPPSVYTSKKDIPFYKENNWIIDSEVK